MIKATVHLRGDYGQTWETVEITADDIRKIAEEKALGNYQEGYYSEAVCEDELAINIKSN